MLIISSGSSSRLRFFQHSLAGSGQRFAGSFPKKLPVFISEFSYTYYNLYTVYTTDIKEDTIVCTPFYPVSEATGFQLVIIISVNLAQESRSNKSWFYH